MKTSNKLLLTFFLALICSTFISMLIARQNMVVTHQEEIEGNNIIVKQELMSNWNSDTLYLDRSYQYILNPDSDAIEIEAEENIIPTYTIVDDGQLDFNIKENQDVTYNTKPKIYIGIKSKDKLSIHSRYFSELSATGPITLNELSIYTEDNSAIDLQVNTQTLFVDAEEHSRISLQGTAQNGDFMMEENSKLDSESFEIDSLWVTLEDHASVYLSKATFIKGRATHNSVIDLSDASANSMVRTSDHARFVNGK